MSQNHVQSRFERKCVLVWVYPRRVAATWRHIFNFFVVQGVPYSFCLSTMKFRSRKMKIPEKNKNTWPYYHICEAPWTAFIKVPLPGEDLCKRFATKMLKTGCIPQPRSLQKVVNTNSSVLPKMAFKEIQVLKDMYDKLPDDPSNWGGKPPLTNAGDKHQVDPAATRSAIWAGGPPRVAVNVPALCLEDHTSQPLGRYKMYPPGN